MASGALRPDDPHRVLELKREFPFQAYIPETEHRGLTLRQLRRVIDFAARHCSGWRDLLLPHRSRTSGKQLCLDSLNLYHLNDWFIKPTCWDDQCSVVELFARSKQTPTWFVSHWWGEPIVDFALCVEKHVQVRGESLDAPYWVCAYANRQHHLADDVCADPRQTSFFKAMLLTKGVLLILDEGGPATPFKRVWCAFEESILMLEGEKKGGQGMGVLLDIATTSGNDIKRAELITDGLTVTDDAVHHVGGPEEMKAQREATFPIQIIREGLHLELEKAEATNPEDRIHILNCLVGRDINAAPALETHENYTKINRRLRAIFAVAAWRQAVAQKGGSIVGELGLSDVVSADVWRESLYLNFAFCKIIDADLAEIARAIPSSLLNLCLDFRRCLRLNDAGFEDLAEALPVSLQMLKLTLTGCRQISNATVCAISLKLPKSLQILDLNFYACPRVNNAAVSTLAAALPPLLQELELNFSWCEQLHNASVAILVNRLPATLQRLVLAFRHTGVTDDVCDAIKELMPSTSNLASQDADDYDVTGLTGDAPGKYIVIRDNTPVATEVDFNSQQFVSSLTEFPIGATVEILEVRCDQCELDVLRVWGRIAQPACWILLLDARSMCRWASMEKADLPGKYIVLREKTVVGFEAERIGDGAGVLKKGSSVDILQIRTCAKLNKLRGQVKKPNGWITLLDKDNGQRVAAPIPEVEKLFSNLAAQRARNVPLKDGIEKLAKLLQNKVGSIEEVEKAKKNRKGVACPARAATIAFQPDLVEDAVCGDIDAPGMYIIIRERAIVRKEVAITSSSVGILTMASAVEVSQIFIDEYSKHLCGQTVEPNGWISILDYGSGYRLATPEDDTKCGRYNILRDNTPVEPCMGTVDRRAHFTKLSKRDCVNVLKIVRDEDTSRIRAKIQSPPGWITVLDLQSAVRYAVCMPDGMTSKPCAKRKRHTAVGPSKAKSSSSVSSVPRSRTTDTCADAPAPKLKTKAVRTLHKKKHRTISRQNISDLSIGEDDASREEEEVDDKLEAFTLGQLESANIKEPSSCSSVEDVDRGGSIFNTRQVRLDSWDVDILVDEANEQAKEEDAKLSTIAEMSRAGGSVFGQDKPPNGGAQELNLFQSDSDTGNDLGGPLQPSQELSLFQCDSGDTGNDPGGLFESDEDDSGKERETTDTGSPLREGARSSHEGARAGFEKFKNRTYGSFLTNKTRASDSSGFEFLDADEDTPHGTSSMTESRELCEDDGDTPQGESSRTTINCERTSRKTASSCGSGIITVSPQKTTDDRMVFLHEAGLVDKHRRNGRIRRCNCLIQ